jgi:cytochrome P450
MTETKRCPVVDFDHNSPEHTQDPVGSYRALRTTQERGWTEANGGHWVLADYQSVFEAARDDDVFSSQRSDSGGEGLSVVIPKTPMHKHIPIEVDPPDFRKYRKVVNRVTSPAAIEKVRPMVERHTTEFVDDIIETGECDLTSVIGVPSIITIDWLGLPVEEWQRYSHAHHATLAETQDSPAFEQAVKVDLPYLDSLTWDVIRRRREEPRQDIISYLVSQEIDDRPITDDEVFSIVDLLISGGVGTTASLVSQSLVWLAEHTDVRQRLIDDPSLLDHAVEEFLRFFSPTQALARTVAQDVDFRGCPMKAGDRVLLSWASANRDADQFDNPDEIDIDRWPNRHTAFGLGVHRCAGSHLGKLMAKTLLGEVLTRMPDYTVEFSALRRYPRQGVNMGFASIPARFTPGARRLPVEQR